MIVEVFSEAKGFAHLKGEWNHLLNRAYEPILFMTHEWQSTWWEHLGEGELLLLAVRRDGGELVGLAPLFLVQKDGQRMLRQVGCVEVSDYLDIIAVAGLEGQVYQALLDYLAGPQAPEWDCLCLCNLPQESPALTLLKDVAQARGYQAGVKIEDVCPVIQLPAGWDEYLEMLDKKQRHEIRRKIRRAEGSAALDWHVVGEADDLEEAMDDFIDLHERSSSDKEQFWNDSLKAFFKAIARVFREIGWLQLSFLRIDGHEAAALLCFDYDDAILVYNSGYDPAQYAHLSPGIILSAYCIRHAISLGRRRFDFLQGDEEYKFRFGAQRTGVYELSIERRR
jgi:CelD/BcsL family acetyltransferase involved in cellulose biosynthesis